MENTQMPIGMGVPVVGTLYETFRLDSIARSGSPCVLNLGCNLLSKQPSHAART
jgi:hypothetical protein